MTQSTKVIHSHNLIDLLNISILFLTKLLFPSVFNDKIIMYLYRYARIIGNTNLNLPRVTIPTGNDQRDHIACLFVFLS